MQLSLIIIVILAAILLSIIQFVYFVIPGQLPSTKITKDIFGAWGNCWITVIFIIAILLYGVALMQYCEEDQWCNLGIIVSYKIIFNFPI